MGRVGGQSRHNGLLSHYFSFGQRHSLLLVRLTTPRTMFHGRWLVIVILILHTSILDC